MDFQFSDETMGTDLTALGGTDYQQQDSSQQMQPQMQQMQQMQPQLSPQQQQIQDQQKMINEKRKNEIMGSESQHQVQQSQPQKLSPQDLYLLEEGYKKIEESQSQPQKQTGISKLSKDIPKYFKEVALLLVVYYLMSLPQVQKTISVYLPQLVPAESGAVSSVGFLIYGLLLAALFFTSRSYLL
jgi:hypothetical protein